MTTRQDHLKQAQTTLQAGQYAAALELAQAVLDGAPDDGEALYLAAVAARYCKDTDKAQDYLAALHSAMPEYGRAWQEQGHLAIARSDAQGALSAFTRAVRYNPALTASWRELARLQGAAGNHAEAGTATAQHQRLAALPQELIAVTNHLAEGRLARAEEICRHFLRRNPARDKHHVEAMRLLAKIGIEFGVLDDAEFLLESAVSFAPDDVQLRLDYIDALRRRQKSAEALAQAELLIERDPENPLFQSRLAIECIQMGDYERGLALFGTVLKKLPNDPASLTSRGHALKTKGDRAEAEASYRAAIAAKPDHGDAWYALANLKTYRFSGAEIDQMQHLAARSEIPFMDRVHVNFALAKALEDEGDYEASFRHYDQGNAMKRAQTRYSADAMTRELARQEQFCTPELFEKHAGQGHAAPDPIFILGLPRAGSTLLEQILASHSQIDGTLELPNILALAHRLRGRKAGHPRYPQILHDLTGEQLAKFGEQFIQDTSIHRAGAPFFIDKMPNNFRHIGLIHLILPHAKIIDARRAPMDCCFSGFKQLFAEGQEFTYGLTEIGRYYADYVQLMEHWDRVLPGKVLRVAHEDVLDDLEGQTRRMLDFLGLPFEQQCLDFHTTPRAVRTASSEQVRQPINRKGQDAWKPFEPWLDELKAALGEAG
ncbi:tetratricopeptide repeat-containing sulfotransferase family protein [Qipengyuania sp. ASV99]|uniref:tetratricopeptide repeat-containing sulfotransferase family protein n=1 Tax=Qipengyuania sp. ASV99 TaxID=3399681 RepID=UPI003A4C56F0